MNNKIIIRKADIKDLAIIQALNNKLFEYEYKGWDKDLKLGWPFSEEGKNYFVNRIENQLVFIAFNNEIPVRLFSRRYAGRC